MKLRSSVRRRYAEVVDFKEYEARIQKLIDTHVSTGEVEKVTSLVNIFDKDAFLKELEKIESASSKADTIAYRTKRTIEEHMGEDPAFYKKFSEMLEDTIREFRAQRLADREYLKKVAEIAESVRSRSGDHLPEVIRHHDVAKAFYGIVHEVIAAGNGDDELRGIAAEAAMAIDEIIRREKIVSWTTNLDVQNRMKNAIEDALHELNIRHFRMVLCRRAYLLSHRAAQKNHTRDHSPSRHAPSGCSAFRRR